MTILTGYINIKKENLKTDLNNETITKEFRRFMERINS